MKEGVSKTVTRESSITVLPGVGKVRAAAYEKIGVHTLGDLLLHYPRGYENRGEIVSLAEAAEFPGKRAMILTVANEAKSVRLRNHKTFLKFRAFDESASCEVVYFNQDYLKSKFLIGSVFRFWGKVERKGKNGLSLSSPVAEAVAPGVKLPTVCPVYALTEGLTRNQIAKDVLNALELLREERPEEPLPEEILTKRGLCTLAKAEEEIHCPTDAKSLLSARERLVYQEFFDFSVGISLTRCKNRSETAPVCEKFDPKPLLSLLPYELTSAQKRVVGEIREDMKKKVPMSRMIVGDVGCGKTVCAALAMLIALQNGRQAVLMAPTEILARQHFADLSPWFSSMGYRTALLVGATPAAEKRKIKEMLQSEEDEKRLDLVIGTHALLSDGVEFARPGLVVTDEQHRFGARQRETLARKNLHAHLLVMSATPIPRSLALVLYGDVDLSRIDEMPAGRQRVDTFVVDESYRERLNGFIEKQLNEGGQVYVVCPAVEEDDAPEPGEMDLCDFYLQEPKEDAPLLHTAVDFAKTLAERFPSFRVAFLHGRMKSREKDAVMKAFSDGEIGILVSTTVIEVGVNVPNATLMVVENAERFGLSQLHQLRGRVGRGKKKAYCVLVGGERLGETAKARLSVMHTTYDGYAIAEEDLKKRGPGDFLGTASGTLRQSGELSFRLANVSEDCKWMQFASEDVAALTKKDPELSCYPLLTKRAEALFSVGAELI